MSRREFLRKSLALGAAAGLPAIVPASALGADGATSPGNSIAMGAVGLGWQGLTNLKSFLAMPDVRVVAICDVDAGHLETARRLVNKTYGDETCAAYNNFEEMFGRGDLDAVSLALPDHWHAIPAIAAARAGLDIYGEKPLTHTLREGRAVCDAVARYGRIWQTGSWQRSRESYRRACELVRNGRIGKVRRVEVGIKRGYTDYAGTRAEMSPREAPPTLDFERWIGPAAWTPYAPARLHKNWRWISHTGGGQLMDWVGHDVDIAHWALGLDLTGPIEIEAEGSIDGLGVWDTYSDFLVTCRYADGLILQIGTQFQQGARWIGDNGNIHIDRKKMTVSPYRLMKEVIGPEEIRLYASRDHQRNFIECVRSRQTTITPAEVAHRSASVGHLALIALRTGRRLNWDPNTETLAGDPEAARLLAKAYREPWQLEA